jgi:sulfate transport system ATP-binding protein
LRRLHEEVRVTTVLVTHDQEEAMDIADSIVVMNHARIEQVGKPEALYDDPASEFVMSFIGQVNRIGDTFIRPHDIVIYPELHPGAERATIERLVHLGFEMRVELVRASGQAIHAQITREESRRLGLFEGQTVYVSLDRSRVFEAAPRLVS